MASDDNQDQAIELLQQLGLKEYEAKCFVGLSRISSGTAKEISEITEVPRTRVYDAIRMLESQGLVEIQHSSPQQFRAVSMEEATETLEDQFTARVDELEAALAGIEPVDPEAETIPQEIWGLTGAEAIANRTRTLIENAHEEVVLIVAEPDLLTTELFESLSGLPASVSVIVGTVTEAAKSTIETHLPDADVFVSGLEWLHQETEEEEEEAAVGRLLLVDRESILVSSYDPETGVERAVYSGGFGNGIVVIMRRLMETGLLPAADSRRG